MTDHTLESIAAALGTPDAAFLEALLDGTTEAQLVGKGRQIASTRVLTDVRRLYVLAYSFWQSATDTQKETLRGFSTDLLAVAAHQAIQLDGMVAVHEEKGEARGATRAALDAALRDVFQKALVLRDQAHDVLLGVAGSDPAAQEEVNQAVGTAEDPATLGRGIGALVALGKKYLVTPSGPIKTRAKLLRLDADYIAKLEGIGAALSAATQAAHARPAGEKITQGGLDRADGINLLLLGLIIRAFDDAHEQDPTIPRLAPIATRRIFDKGSRKKSSNEAGAGASEA